MITPELFTEARAAFGSREAAAEACALSLRQIRRYESGASAPPRTVYRLLRTLSGELGEIDARWAGWRLRGAALYPPWHQEFSLAWFMWLRSHTLAREARERDLERTVEVECLERRLREARSEPEQIDLFCAPPPAHRAPAAKTRPAAAPALDRRASDRRGAAPAAGQWNVSPAERTSIDWSSPR